MRAHNSRRWLAWSMVGITLVVTVVFVFRERIAQPGAVQEPVQDSVLNETAAANYHSQTTSVASHAGNDAVRQGKKNFLEIAKSFLPESELRDWADRLNDIESFPPDILSFSMAVAPLIQGLIQSGKATEYAAALEHSLKGTAEDADKLRMLALLYANPKINNAARERQFLAAYTGYVKDVQAMLRLAELTVAADGDAAYIIVSEAAFADRRRGISTLSDGIRIFSKVGDSERAVRLCQQVAASIEASADSLLFVGNKFLEFGKLPEALQVFEAGRQKATETFVVEHCILGRYEAELRQGQNAQLLPDLARISKEGSTKVVRDKAKTLLTRYAGRP